MQFTLVKTFLKLLLYIFMPQLDHRNRNINVKSYITFVLLQMVYFAKGTYTRKNDHGPINKPPSENPNSNLIYQQRIAEEQKNNDNLGTSFI